MKASLAETQQLFWDAITYPTGVADYLAQADETTAALFNRTFTGTSEFSRTSRVEVYAEAYFFRLLDVLAEQFPLLARLAGKERFHNLVTDYLLAHPSQSPNLRRLGDALPEYLETHPLRHQVPQLPDFAKVELAIDCALDAPDSAVLTREQLAQVDPSSWPRMRLSFCESLQLVHSAWDFHAFRDEERALVLMTQAPRAEPKFEICIWRKHFTVFTRMLSPGEAALLRALMNGASFSDASDAAALHGADAHQLVAHLGRWLQDEMLSGAKVD